jgi:hypothetical protein
MSTASISADLKLSLLRGLLGNVYPDLRQASIEADDGKKIIRIRFEFDGKPSAWSRDACSSASTEVMADFDNPWELEESFISCQYPNKLNALNFIVFLRAEIGVNA